jgi:hypothetical protein
MALVTTVTPAGVAIALGRTAPDLGGPIEQQWQSWIDDALMLIQDRVDAVGADGSAISQAKLDYVVRQAVVSQVQKPDDSTQVTVRVDDASTSKSYRSGKGRVTIIAEWWTLLGLARAAGRAFEVDTTPPGEARLGVDYWWSTPTDRMWL